MVKITKPSYWPENPYDRKHKVKDSIPLLGMFNKMLRPSFYLIIEKRDQQILNVLRKEGKIN